MGNKWAINGQRADKEGEVTDGQALDAPDGAGDRQDEWLRVSPVLSGKVQKALSRRAKGKANS